MFLGMLHKHLAAQSELTAKLASYDFGNGDEPAIFTSPVFPDDASYPAVIIRMHGGMDASTRGISGAHPRFNIQVHTDRMAEGHTAEGLAWLVWSLLQHGSVDYVPSGWNVSGIAAQPPVYFPDEDGYPGYMILCDFYTKFNQ